MSETDQRGLTQLVDRHPDITRDEAERLSDQAEPVTLKRQGLFPCEAEIARRLSQSERRWRAVAKVLEREGLPKIDPLMGGRFWPAIVAFFRARYGVDHGSVMVVPGPPDGEEHWDNYNKTPKGRQRRNREPVL